LLGIEKDIYGAGYNVYQSKVAIGSGGFIGKGFLQGTQTKYNFVPEQSTDFIFCTIGEEWGFVGATLVILLYLVLLFRIISIAERQRHSFGRIYGYGVAACFFFHVFINIGMTWDTSRDRDTFAFYQLRRFLIMDFYITFVHPFKNGRIEKKLTQILWHIIFRKT
jgi:cell division protein FtsW (lipid II flippase)